MSPRDSISSMDDTPQTMQRIEEHAKRWMELVLGEKINEEFAIALQSGELLCSLVNKIYRGLGMNDIECPRQLNHMEMNDNLSSLPILSLMKERNTENIQFMNCESEDELKEKSSAPTTISNQNYFNTLSSQYYLTEYIHGCKYLGVTDSDCFEPNELLDQTNLEKVFQNILALRTVSYLLSNQRSIDLRSANVQHKPIPFSTTRPASKSHDSKSSISTNAEAFTDSQRSHSVIELRQSEVKPNASASPENSWQAILDEYEQLQHKKIEEDRTLYSNSIDPENVEGLGEFAYKLWQIEEKIRGLLLSGENNSFGHVPDNLHAKLWMLVSGAGMEMRRKPGEYARYVEMEMKHVTYSTENGSTLIFPTDSTLMSRKAVESIRQIDCDLRRTVGNQEEWTEDRIQVLRRVLVAYSFYNPKLGYCQGFNYIAARALQFLGEEEAFYLVIKLIQVVPDDYYIDMVGFAVDYHVFADLVQLQFANVTDHLKELKVSAIELSLACSQCFLTLYSAPCEIEITAQVWDVIFLMGDEILFRVALAIIQHQRDKLLKCQELGDAMEILSVIGTNTMDPISLMHEAMRQDVVYRARVEDFRAHHRLLLASVFATDTDEEAHTLEQSNRNSGSQHSKISLGPIRGIKAENKRKIQTFGDKKKVHLFSKHPHKHPMTRYQTSDRIVTDEFLAKIQSEHPNFTCFYDKIPPQIIDNHWTALNCHHEWTKSSTVNIPMPPTDDEMNQRMSLEVSASINEGKNYSDDKRAKHEEFVNHRKSIVEAGALNHHAPVAHKPFKDTMSYDQNNVNQSMDLAPINSQKKKDSSPYPKGSIRGGGGKPRTSRSKSTNVINTKKDNLELKGSRAHAARSTGEQPKSSSPSSQSHKLNSKDDLKQEESNRNTKVSTPGAGFWGARRELPDRHRERGKSTTPAMTGHHLNADKASTKNPIKQTIEFLKVMKLPKESRKNGKRSQHPEHSIAHDVAHDRLSLDDRSIGMCDIRDNPSNDKLSVVASVAAASSGSMPYVTPASRRFQNAHQAPDIGQMVGVSASPHLNRINSFDDRIHRENNQHSREARFFHKLKQKIMTTFDINDSIDRPASSNLSSSFHGSSPGIHKPSLSNEIDEFQHSKPHFFTSAQPQLQRANSVDVASLEFSMFPPAHHAVISHERDQLLSSEFNSKGGSTKRIYQRSFSMSSINAMEEDFAEGDYTSSLDAHDRLEQIDTHTTPLDLLHNIGVSPFAIPPSPVAAAERTNMPVKSDLTSSPYISSSDLLEPETFTSQVSRYTDQTRIQQFASDVASVSSDAELSNSIPATGVAMTLRISGESEYDYGDGEEKDRDIVSSPTSNRQFTRNYSLPPTSHRRPYSVSSYSIGSSRIASARENYTHASSSGIYNRRGGSSVNGDITQLVRDRAKVVSYMRRKASDASSLVSSVVRSSPRNSGVKYADEVTSEHGGSRDIIARNNYLRQNSISSTDQFYIEDSKNTHFLSPNHSSDDYCSSYESQRLSEQNSVNFSTGGETYISYHDDNATGIPTYPTLYGRESEGSDSLGSFKVARSSQGAPSTLRPPVRSSSYSFLDQLSSNIDFCLEDLYSIASFDDHIHRNSNLSQAHSLSLSNSPYITNENKDPMTQLDDLDLGPRNSNVNENSHPSPVNAGSYNEHHKS